MKIAAIQLNAGKDKQANLKQATSFIEEACANQAKLIALPEVFNYRGNKEGTLANAETIEDGESVQLIQKLARDHQAWILIGLMIQSDTLPYNTSLLIDPQGGVIGEYQKIHLFDMKFKGQEILESSKSRAGTKPVITSINYDGHEINIGMSICYDLRFPELYRRYAEKRVEVIAVPSSFTNLTGEAHWHTLVQARAIENQAYIIAPNQGGMDGGVKCYGHSLIVDPWGIILAEASAEHEGPIYADLDLDNLAKIRARLPVLEHRKL